MPAPTLGQHNQEILSKRLGIQPTRLDQLSQKGVI
jgi:crotonobetainyl-CoA:carnitine CoA-transferase CaiB-like acyl-CoA transferase